MMPSRRIQIACLALSLVFACEIRAQQKKEPSDRDVSVPDRPAAPLPQIDLPEFLITGQATIDLPLSSKAAVEEQKTPLRESSAAEQKDAVMTPTTKEEKILEGPATHLNGLVSAGFGNFASPSIEAWFGKNLVGGSVVLNADYASSSGHVADAGWQKTGIGIRGEYQLPVSFAGAESQLRGNLGVSGESYRAYGSANPAQQRVLNKARVSATLSSHLAKPARFDDIVSYSAGMEGSSTAIADSVTGNENLFGIFGEARTQWKNYQLFGSVEYKTSGIAMVLPPNTESHSPEWFRLELKGSSFLTPSLEAALTVRQYIYRGNLAAAGGRFCPELGVRYFVNESVTMFAKAGPSVERNSLGRLLAANKYVRSTVETRPTEIPFSVTCGSEVSFSEKMEGRGAVVYSRSQDYPVCVELGSAKVWDVMYLPNVSIVNFSAQGLYSISPANMMFLDISTASASAEDSANSVPNLPSFTLSGAYRHSFRDGAAIELVVGYVSKRWKDFAHSHANAGYLVVGGKAEYMVIDNLRAALKVENLLDQRYYVWDGYSERPFFVSLGLSFNW